jgi:hypothetical protein
MASAFSGRRRSRDIRGAQQVAKAPTALRFVHRAAELAVAPEPAPLMRAVRRLA